jgi:tetratricopeptide (TPR) repeat protein
MSIKDCSNDSYTWYMLGASLYNQEEREREAIDAFSKAIVLNKSDKFLDEGGRAAWPFYDRGQAYEFIGEASRACSNYKTSADMGDKDGQKKVNELCGSNINIAASDKSSKHDKCISAADYKGCMEHKIGTPAEQGVSPGTVNVATPSEYNYLPKTVKQLKIRGSYGRYIQFIGKTNNAYDGTRGYYNAGSPGRQVCQTYINPMGYGGRTNCSTEGYVAPSYRPGTSGGVQAESFRYELDCKDMTFDRKGDLRDGSGWRKGWMNVSADPTAQAVANKYCGIIGSLPKSND